MTTMNKKRNMAGGMIHEGYEASVAARALTRAGKCPQLKGIANEIMFCDKINANPVNVVRGVHASLTKSTTARMKDVIVQNAKGRVVGHAQLKDTISSSGVRKTADQILNGHYNKTMVCGTKETAIKIGKALAKSGKKVQTIHSNGISSSTTERIANKALGGLPSASALGAAAHSGGVAGAAFGAGIEAISSIADVVNGDKDVSDAVIDVAGAGVQGGITSAASTAAGSAAAGLAGSAVAAATSTAVGSAIAGTAIGSLAVAAAPLAIGFGAACAVGSFISSLFDE